MTEILVFFAVFMTGYFSYVFIRLTTALIIVRRQSKKNQPFFTSSKNPKKHILILGDSTMYGAGVKSREKTIGGLFAKKYPSSSVETYAVNGSTVKSVFDQIKKADHKHYDLIVLGVGGNDIVKFTNFKKLSSDLSELLSELSKMSNQIVLCHSVNLGNIGFFPFPLAQLFDYRGKLLSQIYTNVAAKFKKVEYVNFYRPKHDDYYDKFTRKHFIAEDFFHPNDYANEFFFNLIWERISKK